MATVEHIALGAVIALGLTAACGLLAVIGIIVEDSVHAWWQRRNERRLSRFGRL